MEITSTLIFKNLKSTWSNIGHYVVDWRRAKATYCIDETNAKRGAYTLIVHVLSVRGKQAIAGCYDFDSREQVEQAIDELNECYFN